MTDETRRDLIESKISAERSQSIAITGEAGGLEVTDVAQLFEVAKIMSQAKVMIPQFLQGSPWDCLGVVLQAREWRMSPYQVARMCYVTENPRTKEKQLGFMSQLVHAVLESRAPIKGRMDVRYEGEGDNRVCIVSATLTDALGGGAKEHRSPRLGDRRPKPQERTNHQTGEKYWTTAGSPLWQTKPDVQLAYDTQRDFARIYFPDVLMGVYTDDELKEQGFEEVSQKDLARLPAAAQVEHEEALSSRLSPDAAKRAGFNIERIESEIEKNSSTPPARRSRRRKAAEATEPPQETSAQPPSEVSPSSEDEQTGGEAASPTDASPPLTKPGESAQEQALQKGEGTDNAGLTNPGETEPPILSNDAEYEAHVRAYCAEATDAKELSDWWKGERKLRAQIPNLTADGLDRCKELVIERGRELSA